MQTCKICKLEKEVNFVRLGSNGSLLYADEQGRLWKGKTCADCQAKRRKEQRNKAKDTPNPENPSE